MRKNNRKGFTIVELVIVIAVIAILAGVLIPTFASIISKANASKALQEAQNAYKEAFADAIADDGIIDATEDGVVKDATGAAVWTFHFENNNGVISADEVDEPDDFDYEITVEDGKVVVGEKKAAPAATTAG